MCRFNRLEFLRWRRALLRQNWAAATKHRYLRRFKRLEQLHWRLNPRFLLGGMLVLILASYFYPVPVTPWIWPEYRYRHQRFSGTAVYDQAGRFMGLIPGQLDPLADYSLGKILPPDHKALAPKTIPDGWWNVLRALEDRHLGTWRSWGGIDVLALPRALLWDIPTGNACGASSLTMQLVRSLRHDNPDSNDPLLEKLHRKWVEVRDAPVLMHALGGDGMAALKQWLAMHVPLAIGSRSSPMGESLYGIEVTARIVFGRPAHDLDLGQQAILAAAFWRPIVLVAENDAKGTELRDRRWAQLKERAARGLRLAYGEDDSRTREGLAHLAELSPPQPSVLDALMPLLPADPLEHFQVLANPARRSLTFALGEMRQAIAELQDTYGWNWRERVQAVELTVDATANALFKRRIERALMQLQRFPGLDLNLVATGNRPTAQVIVALAGPNRELRRFYANTEDTVYAGVQSLRDAGGRYRPERETRAIASLGKVPVAVLLGSLGDLWGRWHYCNQRQGSIHNADGDTGVTSCRQPGALYKAEEVFGASKNLPLVERLGHVPEARLQALANAFGLTVLPGTGLLRIALPLGTVTAAPRTVQRMMHGVLLGATGQPLTAQAPRMLGKVWVLGTDGRTTVESPISSLAPSNPVQHYLTDDHARRYVRETLSAPLKARFGGTLSDLEDWVAGKKSGVAIHLAKTGTTTVGGAIRDKWAVGGLLWRERAYSYLVLVGTGDPRQPLGHNVSSNAVLAPLIRIVLEETLRRRAQP